MCAPGRGVAGRDNPGVPSAATSQFKHTLVGQFYEASTRVDVMPKTMRRDSRTSLNLVNR
jgi:hypothetical protein